MATANSITVTALKLIKAAMREIGALAAGEDPSNDDEADVLEKLQRVIDYFNSREPMVYNVNFTRYSLIVDTQPILIGPGQTFDVNQRPQSIESITLILVTASPENGEVEIPLNKRDDAWWASQAIKNLSSTLPTDFYYSPGWPNGQIYFWPVPSTVNDVRIESRIVVSQLTAYGDTFSMPPGYWDAIVYSLAEAICPMFKRVWTPLLQSLLAKAIKAIQVNNISSPRLASDSPSQSVSSRCRPDFSFLTGLPQ
jgi:hypothetical protein